MIKLFLLQLVAHTLSDFFFQNDAMCQGKKRDGMKSFLSPQLFAHVIITLLLSLLLASPWGFWFPAFIVAGTHYVIDGLKNALRNERIHLFFLDQILHIAIIAAACILSFERMAPCQWAVELTNTMDQHGLSVLHQDSTIAIFIGILWCLKPANIIIKKVLSYAKVNVPTEETSKGTEDSLESDELPNAGKIIGNTERLMTLTFVLTGDYEVVGFIMAAKSILRYSESKTAKSEYVLIGTLLSYAIAIFLGLSIKHLFRI